MNNGVTTLINLNERMNTKIDRLCRHGRTSSETNFLENNGVTVFLGWLSKRSKGHVALLLKRLLWKGKAIIFLLFVFAKSVSAQKVNEPVKLTHYVFNKFSPGTVKMKSGESYNQALNYNILTNEMIFDNRGIYLAIASPEKVDTVYINDRKFIPLNNKFYEVLVNSKMPLLLEFTSSINEPGASIGFGGTSNTTAATSFKSLVNSGGAYELKLPDGFKVMPGFSYWVMKEGKLEKAGNAKQLIKFFPDKKDFINDFIKKNNTNFSRREDIIELVKQTEQ